MLLLMWNGEMAVASEHRQSLIGVATDKSAICVAIH